MIHLSDVDPTGIGTSRALGNASTFRPARGAVGLALSTIVFMLSGTTTANTPPYVETDVAAPYLDGPAGEAIRAQSPMHRAATPEEVARVVVFLATPGVEATTGAIVDVNGASYPADLNLPPPRQ